MPSRRENRSVSTGICLFFILIAWSGMFTGANGQARLGGRLNLFYQESRLEDLYSKNADQELNLTIYDDLFAKNMISMSYLLERKTGTSQPQNFLRHRIRSTINGRAFVFTLEYSPPHTMRGTIGETAQKLDRKRLLLGVNPEDYPVFTLSYDRADRHGGAGNFRVDSVNENSLATTGYDYRFAGARATFRERKTTNRLDPGLNRRLREGTGGLTLESRLGRIGSFMASYDGLLSKETYGGRHRAWVRIDNVRGLISSNPVTWLSLSANFLGSVIDRENETDTRTSSQELYTSASYMPKDYLTFQFARDIRETEDDGESTLSDYARVQGTIQGYLRDGIRGKASIQRTIVIKSEEGAFPSNGYFFNLDTDLMPGAILAFDLNVTKTENPNVQIGTYQIRKVIDLRGFPRSDLSINLAYRSLQFGNSLDLFGTKTYDIELDLNYRPKPRFTTILTLTQSVDRRVLGGTGLYMSSTTTYSLAGGTYLSFIYIRRDVTGTIIQTTGVSPQGTYPNNYLIELVLLIAQQTRLSVKYDIRDLSQGGISTVLGITFIKRF